jgi:hypothetical protein
VVIVIVNNNASSAMKAPRQDGQGEHGQDRHRGFCDTDVAHLHGDLRGSVDIDQTVGCGLFHTSL